MIIDDDNTQHIVFFSEGWTISLFRPKWYQTKINLIDPEFEQIPVSPVCIWDSASAPSGIRLGLATSPVSLRKCGPDSYGENSSFHSAALLEPFRATELPRPIRPSR